jgi:hypothetical protein
MNVPDMPPFVPSPEQWPVILDEGRERLVAGGEGSGKSRVGAQELFGMVEPGELYWLGGETYDDTLREFEYLRALFESVGAIDSTRGPTKDGWEIDLKAPFKGTRIRPRLASDVRKIASYAPKGILICEAAKVSEEAFHRFRGRIRRGQRGWALFTGTFEGSLHWYADQFTAWQVDGAGGTSYSIPSWANLVAFPGGEQDSEIQALRSSMPHARFMERHAGTPVPPSTLVHPEFDPKIHVGNHGFRPAQRPSDGSSPERWPVELAIDPGGLVYAVYAVQRDGDNIYIRDEIYATPPQSVAERVIAECRSRPWWKNVTGGVIDVAGSQHHGMQSQVDIWAAQTGIGLRRAFWRINEGIDRMSTFLRDPAREVAVNEEGEPLYTDGQMARLFIDRRCQNLVREFRLYRRPDVKSGRATKEVPIDAHNHGIKAISYWLLMSFGPTGRLRRRAYDLIWSA